jgi:hypothetical protein
LDLSTLALNEKQRSVLRWIADGCSDGVMEGYLHRVSAAALRSRGLVRISGRGPTWRAELTDLGQRCVAELADPESEPGGATGAAISGVLTLTRAQGSRVARDTAMRAIAAPLRTEQLVTDVIAAGGTLLLPDETAHGGVNWRQRAYAAQRHGKVPAGKHLSVSWTSAGFEISLRDGETGNELGADTVPVPARIRNYHPAVQQC